MSETSNTLPNVLLRLAQFGAKLFRQNTGTGWVGTGKPFTAPRAMAINLKRGDVVLRAPVRPLRAGLTKGSSDIIGWHSVIVTPEMVGHRVAIFVGCEVKTATGPVDKDQRNFVEQIQKAGGIAGIARNEDDAVAIIRAFERRF